VWAVLADFGALSSWVDGVDHSCLLEHTGDGIGVGTTRRVQVGRITLDGTGEQLLGDDRVKRAYLGED